MRTTSMGWAGFLVSAALCAQNVVPNSDFPTDANGWSFLQVTSSGWSATEGDPDPGALEVTNSGGFDGYSWGRTCVAVEALRDYAFSYNVKKDGNSVDYPLLVSWIDWYELPDCVGSASIHALYEFVPFSSVPDDVWETHLRGTATAPAGAVSAMVVIGMDHPSAGLATLYFDHVALASDPTLFIDGFETGDESLWSASVP